MKKLTLISFASLSLLCFSSCLKTDDNCCTVPFQPFLGYSIGDLRLYNDVTTAKVGTDSISIIGIRPDSKLTIHIKYSGKGTYILTGNQALFSPKTGSGSTTGTYNVSTSGINKVEITAVDSVNRLANGKFSFTLKKVTASSPGAQPDSVVFTNGEFGIVVPR
jgi:hypothetical protein